MGDDELSDAVCVLAADVFNVSDPEAGLVVSVVSVWGTDITAAPKLISSLSAIVVADAVGAGVAEAALLGAIT